MATICNGGTSMLAGGDDGGLLLPALPNWEKTLPDGIKVILYLMGLFWCFMGVSIIADIFMAAIEKITSAKVLVKRDGKDLWVPVWNPTVANLTLMALGSSAPEILLSFIELIFTEGWHSGELGPSTIVGSAAFNLLVITAVCVTAIPNGETRIIKDLSVFAVTASFSVMAYVWLLFILLGPSPHVVEVWEGVITFLFFPLEVVLAYCADIGIFHKFMGQLKKKPLVFTEESTAAECEEMMKLIEGKYGNVPNDAHDREALMTYEFAKPSTRAAHRVGAARLLAGGKNPLDDKSKWLRGQTVALSMQSGGEEAIASTVVTFRASTYSVCEADKKVNIFVDVLRAVGQEGQKVKVSYRTRDGSAIGGGWFNKGDYKTATGTLTFEKDEICKTITVEVMEDKAVEQTEDFFVDLFNPQEATLGKYPKTKVVVIDSDGPGVLSFEKPELRVPDRKDSAKYAVTVNRTNGATGSISCNYRTEDESAKAGADYTACSGKLEFAAGSVSAVFPLEVLGKKNADKEEVFRIIIENPESTSFANGGDVLTVYLESNLDGSANIKVWEQAMQEFNWDEIAIGHATWKEHFIEAMYVCGSREAQRQAHVKDWILHAVSLPWKLIFSLVPPTDFAGGYVSFFAALAFIGLLTAVIGDMANLLGCALGIKASINAVVFVALGTSLPDTFASKTAAVQDPTADASIGNITGSNGVNVFLGLGMPWTLGAIYWTINGRTDAWVERGTEMDWPSSVLSDFPDGGFVVPAGSLGGSVTVFCCCACVCIFTLLARRKVCGGELGGTKAMAFGTGAFFVSMWAFYIGMCIYFEGGLLI